MKRMLLIAALAAPVLAGGDAPPEMERYKREPRHFQSYQPDSRAFFAQLAVGCANPQTGEAPGNKNACICMAWTLMDRHSLQDLQKIGIPAAGEIIDAYVVECVGRHPLKKG